MGSGRGATPRAQTATGCGRTEPSQRRRGSVMSAGSELVFDPFADAFVRNPYDMFRRLRREAPVYYSEELEFYALTRYDHVAAAFKNYQTYSNTGGLDLAMVKSGTPPPEILLFMDPPEHRRMRSLVSKAFTPRAMKSM